VISRDGTTAAAFARGSGTSGGYVIVWDLASQEQLLTTDFKDSASPPVLSPNGSWLALSHRAECEIWSTLSGKMVRAIDTGLDGSSIEDIAFSEDGQLLALASPGAIGLIETGSWRVAKIWSKSGRSEDQVRTAFSPDNQWLVGWIGNHQLTVIDLSLLEELVSFDVPTHLPLGRLEFGPSSGLLFIAGPEGSFSIDLKAMQSALRELGLDWDER
jgi:WD40 repeat protein